MKWLIPFQWEDLIENGESWLMDMNITLYKMADSLK